MTTLVRKVLLKEAVTLGEILTLGLVQSVLNNEEIAKLTRELVRTETEALSSKLSFKEKKVRKIIQQNCHLL